MHDQRHTEQPSGHPTGAGDVATKAQHAHWPQLANDLAGLPDGATQDEGSLEQRQLALASQPRDVDQVQLQPGIGYQFVFNAPWRAQPMHGVALSLELVGTGQRREHVATGAAGHNQHVSAHGECPPQSRSHRTPYLRCPSGFDSPTRYAATSRGRHSRSPTNCRHN